MHFLITHQQSTKRTHMVKHVVMLRLKDYDNKTQKLENALKLKKAIEDLKIYIDELKYIEVGLNFNEKPSAYDLVLISTFETESDLEIYRLHPEHKKLMVFLKTVTSESAVVVALPNAAFSPPCSGRGRSI